MSLLDVVRALRRFALVFLAILIATAGASYFVWTQVPVTYQSEASMVVLPPNQGTAGPDNSSVPINPYQNAGAQATQVAASALASISVSPEFQAMLAGAGVTSAVTVEVATGGGGVILALTSTNARAAAAKADLTALADLVSLELRTRQLDSGAPESTLITADLLIVPNDAAALATDRTKVVSAVAIIGVIIALVAVVLLEILHRPRRKQAAGTEDADEAESYPRVGAESRAAAEPSGAAVSALAAIDEALALSEPDLSTPFKRRSEDRDDEAADSEQQRSDDRDSADGRDTATAPDLAPLPFDDDLQALPMSVGWPLLDDEMAAPTRLTTSVSDHADDGHAHSDDSYDDDSYDDDSYDDDADDADERVGDADDSRLGGGQVNGSPVTAGRVNGNHVNGSHRDVTVDNAVDDTSDNSTDDAIDDLDDDDEQNDDSSMAKGWPVLESASVGAASVKPATTKNGQSPATRWSSPDQELAPLPSVPTSTSNG